MKRRSSIAARRASSSGEAWASSRCNSAAMRQLSVSVLIQAPACQLAHSAKKAAPAT